jgi:hypothetical protein
MATAPQEMNNGCCWPNLGESAGDSIHLLQSDQRHTRTSCTHRMSCQTAGRRLRRRRSHSSVSSCLPLSISALVISCGTVQLLWSWSGLSSQNQLLSSSKESTTSCVTRLHCPHRSHCTQLSATGAGAPASMASPSHAVTWYNMTPESPAVVGATISPKRLLCPSGSRYGSCILLQPCEPERTECTDY